MQIYDLLSDSYVDKPDFGPVLSSEKDYYDETKVAIREYKDVFEKIYYMRRPAGYNELYMYKVINKAGIGNIAHVRYAFINPPGNSMSIFMDRYDKCLESSVIADEITYIRIFMSVLKNIIELNVNNIINRDIKTGNILIDTKNDKFIMIDFDIARYNFINCLLNLDVGTDGSHAPELSTRLDIDKDENKVIRKQFQEEFGVVQYSDRDLFYKYDESVDIWAFGIMMLELLYSTTSGEQSTFYKLAEDFCGSILDDGSIINKIKSCRKSFDYLHLYIAWIRFMLTPAETRINSHVLYMQLIEDISSDEDLAVKIGKYIDIAGELKWIKSYNSIPRPTIHYSEYRLSAGEMSESHIHAIRITRHIIYYNKWMNTGKKVLYNVLRDVYTFVNIHHLKFGIIIAVYIEALLYDVRSIRLESIISPADDDNREVYVGKLFEILSKNNYDLIKSAAFYHNYK